MRNFITDLLKKINLFLFRNIIRTNPLRLCLFTLTVNVIFPRVIYVSKRPFFLHFLNLPPASRVEQQAVSLSKQDYLFSNYGGFVKFKNAGTCIPPAFLYGLQQS